MAYSTKTYSTEVINCITGEILRIESQKVIRKEYDFYMKTYYENLLKDNSVPTQTELSILYQLFQIIKFGSIDIYINHLVIKNIAKNMSLTTRSINLGIEGLIKKKIILKPEPCRFILNPVYYFQGTESEKEKKLIEINEIFASIQELQKDIK